MKERRGWKGARYQDEGSGQEASKVFNIKVEFAYLNSDYDLVLLQGNEITGQGLLLCGKLKPKKPLLPEFLIRWDEKGDHLNVDIKHDKKCQDDDHRAVGQSKGRMDIVNNNNQQDED